MAASSSTVASSDKNLTGEQIQQVLDLFLYKALEPIILYTDMFDQQVAYILSVVSSNRKRKVSSLDRDRTVDLLCRYLFATDRRKKFEILREAKIERSFLHVFANRFLQKISNYCSKYNAFLLFDGNTAGRNALREELNTIAVRLGCKDRQSMYTIATVSLGYLKRFYDYRAQVLEKYAKQASSQAKAHTSTKGSNFDFNDVRQTILKGILLAIDKYDSERGALTTYINWWVLNAQTCNTSEHEYGIAYVVPQSQRKKIAEHTTSYLNHSVSLDELADDEGNTKNLHSVIGDGVDHDDQLIKSEADVHVRRIAKLADVRGCARLVLEIGECFSEADYAKMRAHTEKECK